MSLPKTLLPLPLLALLASGQVRFDGTCPQIDSVPDFNQSQFLKRWYQYATYEHEDYRSSYKCTFVKYYENEDGLILFKTGYEHISQDKGIYYHRGNLRPAFMGDHADFEARFLDTTPPRHFKIIDVNYTSHALLWDCHNDTFHDIITKETTNETTNFQALWILTTVRVPSNEVDKIIAERMTTLGLSTRFLRKTDQTNCSEA